MVFFWYQQKVTSKISNTGIEIEQCRYLHFIANGPVWRAKFFQRDSFKIFLPYLELPASVFPLQATKAPSHNVVWFWSLRWG
jgi:hypothetical protein